jgi:hypothetical protein
MNKIKTGLALLGCAVLIGGGTTTADAGQLQSASGHGTRLAMDDDGNVVKRQFSFNAKQHADGTVTGQAQVVNKAFSGTADSPAPYRAHLVITCMQTFGNIAVFGGYTKSTNDPNLDDAAYFSVQDNGEPGTTDMISGLYFYDDNPETQGDPSLCLGNDADDFLLQPIDGGNIQVRPAG